MTGQEKLPEKRWDKGHEKELYELWKKEKQFARPVVVPGKRMLVIDNPPPYPSGRWHMGGAIHFSQIDMIARYFRMAHGRVWLPVGIDRNGLPIESRTEKDFGIRAHETPRRKFLELCKKKLDEYEHNIVNIMSLMGLSVDWDELYRTDSPEYRALTQATFIELWKKGLIYEANKPNNWCPGCKTTLADAEVEYRRERSGLHYIKFPLKGGGHIEIATTRPEMLGACRAVIVHPTEGRFSKLAGKTAIVPLYGREVPVIAREEANPEFGTGAMMICSYGDQEDVRLFRELKLEETIVLDRDGKMNENAGKYRGMTAREAREAIVADLRKEGFLLKSEELEHNVPICWRSKDEIEIISIPELYLKQQDFVGEIRKMADRIKFHPPEKKQLLLDWIGAVNQDWPISRRRFYGTPVPIFYCPEHGAWVPEPGRYYEAWEVELPCPKCGKPSPGDKRVLDTWMDSSISALWVSGYMRDDALFRESFPVFLRPQGKEIVRTWLFYTLLRVYQLTGKCAFEHVWISGHVVDAEGKKMSKSIGNVLYPEPLVEKYGADALRFQGAAEVKVGSDIRIAEERIQGASKFLQKLYNVARFISRFERAEKGELKPADRWILSELSRVVKAAREGYEQMDFFVPANSVRNFVWDLFASHYIEMVKHRAYEGDTGALYTLHEVLDAILRLLAPITPFITDYLYRALYGSSVHVQGMPEPVLEEEHPTRAIVEFNERVWAAKKGQGKSLRDPIEMAVPAELGDYRDDLVRMHNLSTNSE